MPLRFRLSLFFLVVFSLNSFSQACIPLQGVLTGSTVCRGVQPSLTFTATVGTGPFTLTYTNGTTNFIQNNVQSGVPFTVPDLPQINTTYTLTSIKDASACPPVQVTGLSAGANLIVNGDFSAGNSGFASSYTYDPVNVTAGEYFVGTDPSAWNPGMPACHDHTTGNGNMMLINGSVVTNIPVWTETITVTPNTDYIFSTWVQTITTLNPGILQFSINGIEVGNLFTANSSFCVWDKFYTTWNSGSSVTATISLLNMNQAYSGNDFALDDISFAGITAANNSTLVTVQDCSPCPGFPSQLDFSFDQSTCNPLDVKFVGINVPGGMYNWDFGDGGNYLNSPNPPHEYSQSGSYPVTLKISLPSGCSNTITKTITVQVLPSEIVSNKDTTICAGKSVPLHGKPGLDFCWTPSAGLSDAASADPIATPLSTTKYYFTTRTTGNNLIVNGDFSGGNSGFSSAYTYDPTNVTEGEYFVGTSPHNWNPNAPVTCGDHTSGGGNMMILNGSLTFGVNVWQEQVAVSPNTNYAFSTWIQSISPFSPAILQFSMNGLPLGNAINASPGTCAWQQFSTVWNSGNNTTVTISLVNENTAVTGNDFALDDMSFAPVTMQIDSVTITVDNPVVLASPDLTVCPGAPAQLSATGAQTYLWTPALGLSDPAIANPVAHPTAATSYIVTGTTANGCVAKDTVVVSLYPVLLAILNPDTVLCPGGSAQLRASGGGLYAWSPAQYLDNPGSASPVAQPPSTTKFFVTTVDANHCTDIDSVTVGIRPKPVFHKPSDLSVCAGFAGVLKSANDPGDQYAWSPAGSLSDPNAPAPTANPGSTTIYTLQIADSVCAAYDSSFSVTMTVNPSPVVIAQKSNDITCTIPTAQLSASGAALFLWSPAQGLSDPRVYNPLASLDSTTTFIVQGTDRNGCSAYDTLTVTVTATGKNLFVVPNAFTPNGDGHNDCFGIRSWGSVTVEEFSVYNRSGQRIFTTRNPSGCWDGTFKGREQEAGTYVYVIRGWSFCGHVTRTGTIMLIR